MKKNKTASNILTVGLVLVFISGGLLLWFWKSLPPQIPWFYSLPWGEQQLVNKIFLGLFIPGLAILLTLTRAVGFWAGKGDETVENTIMMGGLTAVVLILAGFFRVMQIMGYL